MTKTISNIKTGHIKYTPSVRLFLISGSNFIGYVGAITASKGILFAKIVPNKLTKKQCLLRFLLEILDCRSYVQYYLILTDILNVINSQEIGFARMLQSDAVIWFQRYQRCDLKRGSLSLAHQIAPRPNYIG
jgi:hypothetical protein